MLKDSYRASIAKSEGGDVSSDKATKIKELHEDKHHEDKQPKNFGGPTRVIVTAFAVFIISQLLAVLLIGAGLSLSNQGSNLSAILEKNATVQFIYVLLAEAMTIGLIMLVLKKRGLAAKAIGLGRRPQWQDLFKALLAIVAFYVILIAATALIKALLPQIDLDQPQDVGFKNLATATDQMLAFVALVLIPPLGEEVLIRGYLYSGLRSRWRFGPAMLITSLLFGVAHLGSGDVNSLLWGAALTTLLLSVVLVYLRERTGALYAGMLVHGINNAVAFAVLFRS